MRSWTRPSTRSGPSSTPPSGRPRIQNVCKIDAEEQPFINLWATTRYWFISDKIHNFVSTPGPGMGNYYKAAETWFVQP